MSAIQYLLDENVDPLFRRELLKREPEMIVWRVGSPGVPPNKTPDPEILCWCEKHNFILVTNNRKSIPGHLRDHLAEGRHIPGILELKQNMTIGETIEELLLIWSVSTEDDYRDRLEYLPIT
jgi:hypothetical protein